MPTRQELEAMLDKKRAREDLEAQLDAKRAAEDAQKVDEKPYTMPESIEAFGKSAADMATMGYLPQIQAGVSQLTKGGAPSVKDYVRERDTAIDELAQLKQRQPLASTLGAGAGLVGGAIATGGMGAAAKGASMAQKLFQAAKIGGAQGLLANPGDTEGEIGLQAKERLQNAAIAAPLSALGQGVSEKLPGLVKSGAEKLKDASQKAAYQALGARKRFVSQNLAKDNLKEIGQTLLDKEVITKTPTSLEKMLDRVVNKTEESGQSLDSLINKLAEKEEKVFGRAKATDKSIAVPGQRPPRGGIDKSAISKSMYDDLIQDLPLESVQGQNQKFAAMIDDFNQGGPMSLKEANDFKIKLGKMIKWDRLPNADIPIEEQFYRSLYSKLRQGTEDSAEFLAGETGDLARYLKAKKDYGNLKNAELILKDKIAANEANRMISPSDYFMGGVGSVAGGLLGDSPEDKAKNMVLGAGLGGANKMVRQYGPQVAAKLFQAGSEKMGPLADKLASFPPGSLPQGLERLRESMAKENKSAPNKVGIISEIRKNPDLINRIKDPKLREMILKEMEK